MEPRIFKHGDEEWQAELGHGSHGSSTGQTHHAVIFTRPSDGLSLTGHLWTNELSTVCEPDLVTSLTEARRTFFVPNLSILEAEDFRTRMKAKVERDGFFTVSGRRIYSVTHWPSATVAYDTVGQPSSVNPEPVLLILETEHVYLGFTYGRGVMSDPYLIGKKPETRIVEFA